MPNSFAYMMLLIWPLVAVGLFRFLPVERALIWTILGGYLILPQSTAFDLPAVPALDKVTLPNLTAFLICFFIFGRKIIKIPKSVTVTILLSLFVFSPLFGVMRIRQSGKSRTWNAFVHDMTDEEVRIVMGGAINSVIFSYLRSLPEEDRTDALRAAAEDSLWLKRLLGDRLPAWPYGWVPIHFLIKRITRIGDGQRTSGGLKLMFILFVGFLFDLVVYVVAQARMARGAGAGHW